MNKINWLVLILILISSHKINAQFQGRVFVEDSSSKVFQGTKLKTLAWCGGFNNLQYSSADLNNDGLNDLVIFQSDQYAVKTFINYGTAGIPDYRYKPEYAANFPFVLYYLILKDFNKDGIEDLFEWGGFGITVYHGYYNGKNELCFKKYKSLFYNNDKSTMGWINAEVNPGDIPAIVDVDNDGDLDFLSYYGDGYYMNWYQNMQVEKGLSKDSIDIRLADRCWGKMRQSVLRTHVLGTYCDNSALMRKTDEIKKPQFKITDGGNVPCLLDIDGDGDYDVLDGHRAFDYIVFLENGKSDFSSKDSMIYQDTVFRVTGDTVKIAQWAAPAYVDVDQDGKRDLMLSPNTPLSSENYYCSKYYKNIGTDINPTFKYEGDTFLVSDAIDVGSNSYPVFYDYNRDGKPDLFVGNRGYYDSKTGQFIGKIMYLENTSTPSNPSFKIITNDFLGLSAKKFKGASIAIGDIDNDGKDDMIIGHTNGEIDFIKNLAASPTDQPVWSSATSVLKDNLGTTIACNSYAAPLVYDIDADGKPDLLIGDQMGSLYYYKNTSTSAGIIELTFANDRLGDVKTDPEKMASGHSTPFIGKIDNTGKEYLLLGSRSGRIFRYEGFEGGNVFSAFKRLDSAYSYILSDRSEYTTYMSTPAVADIDNDGKYEMVVGNIFGGLLFFKQNIEVNINEAQKSNDFFTIFPNPTQKEIHFKPTYSENNMSLYIYNSFGQLVKEVKEIEPSKVSTIKIEDLPSGIYYCKLINEVKNFKSIFIKL